MKTKRQSTVEPVFGALINHLGMRKINTIGIRQANKNMLMAAVAHNLKFDRIEVATMANEVKNLCFYLYCELSRILKHFRDANFPNIYFCSFILRSHYNPLS